jgi:hypothetical protein
MLTLVAVGDASSIFFKDSVYTAVGLSASVLSQHLDFDPFLTSTLVQEVQAQGEGYNILRRRIAILVGQWVTVKISVPVRPTVYEIFQFLLDPNNEGNDLVVRITAARNLRLVIDEWDFKRDDFMPYAAVVLQRLMGLIQEVEATETKMVVLTTISSMIERLEHEVRISPLNMDFVNNHRSLPLLNKSSLYFLLCGKNQERSIF